MTGYQKNRVRLNVGGRIFETTATTLANAGRNSLFGAMFDDSWNLQSDNTNEYFIDRNPDCFAVLLDLLRSNELCVPANMSEKLLYREALYYGVLDHVRSAKWGPFDGNRLWLSRTVAGQAPGDGTAIRAGPDGGCCVAHGCMVHVYDWMLDEHPPINLDYQTVNDVGWLDSENIVVSVCERMGRGDGGIGLFSSSSGELRDKFQVSHENQVKSFTAGALSFSSDYKIYSSCKGRSNEYGIGVWDQITGKQTDFFYEPLGWSLGDADKLQWLNGSNCLLVATLFPRNDNCYISLLDFREKKMVWSWSDMGAPITSDEKRVRDAIAMEESNAICVVNEYEDLGFIDIRNSGGSVRWSSRSKLMKGKMPDEPCYPKLALHEGQLFSSMNDSISVFCGPDWVLTSRLRRSYGGSICDFSIGGDRLFALHSEENVFDIWETPPSPII
ncbi:BTB/POZ domain-containing protein At2g24240-like [Argentina anserina]|uniref:BTB/POZ domain-containing protein At2g24240-like n=1 Tax=Argentina anserina TaxID=57926 RepID=UPI002176417F|nr:BTB/POZ domain-containing protein At2g24240-like [Potentilla anserina]XP_050371289.1 BTB/POZ domain-containing protein At2g24240-like [Potentilla anserina]